MVKDEQIANLIYEKLIHEGQVVLFIGVVKKIHDKSGSDNRFLYMTTNRIGYFKIKNPPQDDRHFEWNKIHKVVDLKGRIELFFAPDPKDPSPQQIRFESPLAGEILTVIKVFLFSFMDEKEFSEIGLSPTDPVRRNISPYFLLHRFYYEQSKLHNGVQPDLALISKMNHTFLNHLPSLSISPNDKLEQCFLPFLNTITYANDLKSISFPFLYLRPHWTYLSTKKWLRTLILPGQILNMTGILRFMSELMTSNLFFLMFAHRNLI